MIEVIYKDESQEGQNGEEPFGLPRNIRQIGLAAEDYRIYMEDYVYTFLVRLARTEDSLGEAKTRVAVLTGNLKMAFSDSLSVYQRCYYSGGDGGST